MENSKNYNLNEIQIQSKHQKKAVGVSGAKVSTTSAKASKIVYPKKPIQSIRSTVVGDSQIGKTCLVQTFLFDHFNKEYIPTARDDYTYCTSIEVKGQVRGGTQVQDVDLDICDTGGQSSLDRLRPLCYGKTDVVIICFSVVIPSSFTSIGNKWIPEIKRHCLNYNQGMKTILVGTQSDLRSNVNLLLQLMDDGLTPISETRALRLAKKIGAVRYLECSALNKYNLKKIFDVAMTPTLPLLTSSVLLANSSATSSSAIAKVKGSPISTSLGSGDWKQILWRRWRLRQKSTKIKRLMFSCLY